MNGSNTRRCTGHKVTKKIYSIRIILKLDFNVENFEKCFYICAHTFRDVMIRSMKMNRLEGENVHDIVRLNDLQYNHTINRKDTFQELHRLYEGQIFHWRISVVHI